MIHGIDTTFLVQLEVAGHPGHGPAQATLARLLDAGDRLALAPQVLTEAIHVVTDPRRFERPLNMVTARDRAEAWWNASEVVHALPNEHTTSCFLRWMREHGLGRKRLLDTFLAATYASHEIDSIVSSNARDFAFFSRFDIIEVG